MIRLGKIAAVTVLLVFAPTQVWAECAWVLWQQASMEMGGRVRTADWDALVAFPAKADCEAAMAAKVEDAVQDGAAEVVNEAYVIFAAPSVRGLGLRSLWLKCLPDTIDPRGPKGGGR